MKYLLIFILKKLNLNISKFSFYANFRIQYLFR